MGRRLRGLQHLISTKDKLLVKCYPSDAIPWEEYLKDCEMAVNTSDLHSDEYSTDDEKLAREEREQGKRPERMANTNSVIKVRGKPWRSTRVCNNLFLIV